MTFSLIAELTVGLLLVVMIGYCYILNRRLVAFKADEALMRSVVTDLMHATTKAEQSIQALREISQECAETLQDQIRRGEILISELDQRMGQGGVPVVQRQAAVPAQADQLRQAVASAKQVPVHAAKLQRSANSALEKIRSRAA